MVGSKTVLDTDWIYFVLELLRCPSCINGEKEGNKTVKAQSLDFTFSVFPDYLGYDLLEFEFRPEELKTACDPI